MSNPLNRLLTDLFGQAGYQRGYSGSPTRPNQWFAPGQTPTPFPTHALPGQTYSTAGLIPGSLPPSLRPPFAPNNVQSGYTGTNLMNGASNPNAVSGQTYSSAGLVPGSLPPSLRPPVSPPNVPSGYTGTNLMSSAPNPKATGLPALMAQLQAPAAETYESMKAKYGVQAARDWERNQG